MESCKIGATFRGFRDVVTVRGNVGVLGWLFRKIDFSAWRHQHNR